MDDIVKVARTSHGTFYLYFSNKEDLLRALVGEAGEVVASLDDALGPVGPDAAGWQELRTWMERFSVAWQRYAAVLRAWTDLVMSDTELGAQAHAAAGGVASTLAARIDSAGPHPGIDPNAAAEWLYIIRGRSFLRNMVRKIVGTLLEVGRGRISPAEIDGLFELRDRTRSGPTAPAHGLSLMSVEYAAEYPPPDFES